MKNIEQYKDVFSQVHTDVTIRMEDYKKMKKPHNGLKKTVILSAALCLLFACTAMAYATNLFGLKDVVLGNETIDIFMEDGTIVETPITLISLQGYTSSNEYKAAAEWLVFLDSYDQDMALLNEVGNEPTGLDEKYDYYLVYTQEMADKLDEIAAKYGLSLHTSMQAFGSAEELFQLVGTGDFLGTVNELPGGYFYDDGTFQYDGTANLGDEKYLYYQFRNCEKGIFDEVYLNIGDTGDYDEWEYETASGISVTISSSPDKAVLTADLDTSFVTVNILPEYSATEITAADLEAFADSIDFSMIK